MSTTWSAIITDKSALNADGSMTVQFSILKDDVSVIDNVSAYGTVDTIQQEIEKKVRDFAPQWDLAQGIQVGDKLEII